ncbi:unnamed protein product [Chironomus riparius]|uniref:Uncharacterized protein n=1 Tax=Chironomus riparius TaxID=315576 RepID=A0A9N9RK15_9DIPT|nr:unnamed protein product [Chironomus riparius]
MNCLFENNFSLDDIKQVKASIMKFLIFLTIFIAVLYAVAATEIDKNQASSLDSVDLDPSSVNHQNGDFNRAKRYARGGSGGGGGGGRG